MKERNSFLNPKLSLTTLDTFVARRRVFDAIISRRDQFSGTVLDIGCGNMPYKTLIVGPQGRAERYIGLDLSSGHYGKPDLEWNGRTIPLEENSVDCAIATEVFEHCPDVECVMEQAIRVLKPGGMLFFTVPFYWPLHDVPYDEYRYTPFSLQRHLQRTGFARVEIRAEGGWNASFAQMIGLWVRRSGLPRRTRFILSAVALPIVRYLVSHDKPSVGFPDQTMMTGLSGIALKPLA